MKDLARVWTREEGAGAAVGLPERLAVELGPLLAFFVVTQAGGIERGTLAFMAATLLALVAGIWRERRIPLTPLLSAILILAFGATSLFLAEPWIIMVRPTWMNLFYAGALIGALGFGQLLLKRVLGGSLVLSSDRAWLVLTLRLVAFLVFLAILNELVWRNGSVETWVAFKTFGVLPMNLAFAASQIGYVRRHRV